METNGQQVQNNQRRDVTMGRVRREKVSFRQRKAARIASRLLWIPIGIQLISGLTILIFPKIWRPFFLTLAVEYPELSVSLSRSMLAAGTFLSLLAGINLFILSAYQQKARWAWILFLLIVTFFWGGCLKVAMNAGITLAAILSATVILLSWVGLGMSASEFFGSRSLAPAPRRS
jgi:hypothetical protein